MNYFEFYDIPVSFRPDKALVRKRYIEISRKSHPDFFAVKSAGEKENSLDVSTVNTKAYQVLNNDDQLIQYVLGLHGMAEDGEKYQLPQEFLMDMMDVNEQLMDMEMDFDKDTFSIAERAIEDKFDEINSRLQAAIEEYEQSQNQEALKAVKDAWYRKKYLLRIQQRLDTFATQN